MRGIALRVEEVREYVGQERVLAKYAGGWFVCMRIGEVDAGEKIEHYWRCVKKVTWAVDFKGHQLIERHGYDVDYMIG